LIGFNFSQPFLINRAVLFSQEATTRESTNLGYGLIGAYVITFCGIAVRTVMFSEILLANDV